MLQRGGGRNQKKTHLMLLVCCRRPALVSASCCSSRVRLLLLPVDGVEPRDLLPVVEALEVVVAEGLALARVVGIADALFFGVFFWGGERKVEVEKRLSEGVED